MMKFVMLELRLFYLSIALCFFSGCNSSNPDPPENKGYADEINFFGKENTLKRPNSAEVVRAFGGGSSRDPELDKKLRKQVIGSWKRKDLDWITFEFEQNGKLSGTESGEDNGQFSVHQFNGQWEINDGYLRITKPDRKLIIVQQIRLQDEDTLLLFDSVERLDYAAVFFRQKNQSK